MADDAEAANCEDISKVAESEGFSLSKVWVEVKEWKTNWIWVTFFKALFWALLLLSLTL